MCAGRWKATTARGRRKPASARSMERASACGWYSQIGVQRGRRACGGGLKRTQAACTRRERYAGGRGGRRADGAEGVVAAGTGREIFEGLIVGLGRYV